MLRYILKRLLFAIPVILGVTLIAFLILYLTPGDPVDIMLGSRATPEAKAALRAQLGLDKPIPVQYGIWLSNIARGDFGKSLISKQPVVKSIADRLPYTLALTLTALLLSVIVGIPVGVLAAIKQNSVVDHVSMGAAMFFYSVPNFWLGLMLMLIFSLTLQWLPVSGAYEWKSLILPALALGLPQIGSIARLMRAETLEVKREEYVLTARAKGVSEWIVTFKHILRNAAIPVIVVLFLALPWLIGGSVVIETIFAWPGMGQLMYQAILQKDFPVIQALLLIIAFLTVAFNLMGDVVAGLMDPRIRVR
jgi:peptide/nickel transport system permease protein